MLNNNNRVSPAVAVFEYPQIDVEAASTTTKTATAVKNEHLIDFKDSVHLIQEQEDFRPIPRFSPNHVTKKKDLSPNHVKRNREAEEKESEKSIRRSLYQNSPAKLSPEAEAERIRQLETLGKLEEKAKFGTKFFYRQERDPVSFEE